MAKDLYLIYNTVLKQYIFSDGPNYTDHRYRQEWGYLETSKLVELLQNTVNFRRRSILKAAAIPEEAQEAIERLFNGTKIKVEFSDRLEKRGPDKNQ